MNERTVSNRSRLVVLAGSFAAVIVVIGTIIDLLAGGGWLGFVIVVVVAIVATSTAYRLSDRVVLAVSGARPADPAQYPRLYNLVEGLAVTAGVAEPRLYVIEDDAPNALTTGRGRHHNSIAVTTGLVDKLNRIELEAVLAHEISHIRNDDVTVDTVAVTTGGLAVLMTDLAFRERDDRAPTVTVPRVLGYPFLLVAPLSARLLRYAIVTDREPSADLTGVGLTRYPPGLIAALEKLRDDPGVARGVTAATAHLWSGDPGATPGPIGPLERYRDVLDLHPPIVERIERLREL